MRLRLATLISILPSASVFVVGAAASASSEPQFLHGVDIGDRPVAVSCLNPVEVDDHCSAVQAAIIGSLRDHGYTVFDQRALQELQAEAVKGADEIGSDAAALARLAARFEAEVLISLDVQANATQGLGRYWFGTALVTATTMAASTGRVLGVATNVPMGVPGSPSMAGESEMAAKTAALRRAASETLRAMGIVDAYIGAEPRLEPEVVPWTIPGLSLPGGATTVEFHPLSPLAAVGTEEGELVLVDLEGRRTLREVDVCASSIAALRFQPGGSRIAAACDSSRVGIVDVGPTSRALQTFTARVTNIAALDFGRSGFALYGISERGTATSWSLDASPAPPLRSLGLQTDLVAFFMALRGQVALAVAESRSLVLRVGDTAIGAPLVLDNADDASRRETILNTAADISADSLIFAVAQRAVTVDLQRNRRIDEGRIEVVDVASLREVAELKPERVGRRDPGINSVSFGSNWRFLVSGGEDQKLRVWDVDRGLELVSVDVGFPIDAVAFSSDSRWLLVSGEGRLTAWRLE